MLKLFVSTMRAVDLPPVICVAERLGTTSLMLYLRCFQTVSEQTGRKANEEGQVITILMQINCSCLCQHKRASQETSLPLVYSLSLSSVCHLSINYLSLPVSCSLFSLIPVLSLSLSVSTFPFISFLYNIADKRTDTDQMVQD